MLNFFMQKTKKKSLPVDFIFVATHEVCFSVLVCVFYCWCVILVSVCRDHTDHCTHIALHTKPCVSGTNLGLLNHFSTVFIRTSIYCIILFHILRTA